MSNALLVGELENAPGSTKQLREDLTAAVTQENSDAQKPAPKATDVPEKYQGKSVEDVIDMHRNAESALGRATNELGQYKSMTDSLLDLKRREDLVKGGADAAGITEIELPSISSTDLLDNPTEAINRVVETRLTADSQKRETEAAERVLSGLEQDFATKHPDAGEIAASDKFVAWVGKSPLRLRAARAAYEKDWQSGIDLLDEYKAQSSQDASDDDNANEEAALEAARQASTLSAGASQVGDGTKGKTYRRLDLIRLKLEDPEAYGDPGFQQEIMRAYSEGRVK